MSAREAQVEQLPVTQYRQQCRHPVRQERCVIKSHWSLRGRCHPQTAHQEYDAYAYAATIVSTFRHSAQRRTDSDSVTSGFLSILSERVSRTIQMDHLFDQTHAGGELHIDRLLSHTTMLRTQWLEHSSLNTRFNLRPNCAGKTCATSSGNARGCCLPLSARQEQRKGRERGKAASRGIVPSLVGVHLSP